MAKDNVYAYAGRALGVDGTLKNHEDYFYGNKVVLTGTDVGGPQVRYGDEKFIASVFCTIMSFIVMILRFRVLQKIVYVFVHTRVCWSLFFSLFLAVQRPQDGHAR